MQYDRYLESGRFARRYASLGEFRSFTMLFVTTSTERIQNIREAAADRSPRLHQYYRLSTFERTMQDFFGSVWLSRELSDTLPHALVQQKTAHG